jgi:putative endonuclease
MENLIYYIYFLKSQKNGKIYTGYTEKDPRERLKDHNYGSNKWTKENGPLELLHYEKYFCKNDAQEREKFYKSGFGRLIRDSIIDTVKKSVSAKGGPAYGGG